MKNKNSLIISCLVLIISIIVFLCSLYNYGLSKVSNDNTFKKVEIKKGSVDSIADTLYRYKLIKSKLAFKVYVRLNNKRKLMAATYNLSENMGTRKIVHILCHGKNTSNDIKITFKEGINMRVIASIIESKTNNTEDDVYSLLKDESYLDSIIAKYWFLDEKIKNPGVYYSLEGYLYPNTYMISSKDSKVDEIFNVMLDEMDKRLSKYKSAIESSSFSVNELITLASIVELEGTTIEERKKIARVFMNRLSKGMNLGSDVTTYYGVKVDMGTRDLYSYEVNVCNDYNTRCPTFKKLPIAPICNPSDDAIEAVVNPDDNNYLYFVADKNKKIYFSKTQNEHSNIINKLKKSGLWYEY